MKLKTVSSPAKKVMHKVFWEPREGPEIPRKASQRELIGADS